VTRIGTLPHADLEACTTRLAAEILLHVDDVCVQPQVAGGNTRRWHHGTESRAVRRGATGATKSTGYTGPTGVTGENGKTGGDTVIVVPQLVPLIDDGFHHSPRPDATRAEQSSSRSKESLRGAFRKATPDGYQPRQTGSSHAVFKTPWVGDPRINIQDEKGKAKTYQVRQVLLAIDKLAGLRNER
jgi:hypothetical protein